MLRTCFHLLLHFTNAYADRKGNTANTLAKLSKYLISSLFFFACVLWVRVCIRASSTMSIHISIAKIYSSLS